MNYFTDIDVNSVMMEKGISATAARVLYMINRFVHASRMKGIRDKRGIPYSYASRETIAQKIGRSARTVARAIAELKAAGLIEVKRTKRNAHIFLCYYGACGTSGNAENGTSNNSNIKNINNGISIYPHKPQNDNGQLSKDGLLNSASATAEEQCKQQTKDEQRPGKDRTKGRPTPKQRKRLTKAEKEMVRRRYLQYLEDRLGLNDGGWCDFYDEYKRVKTLAAMIADAMSASSHKIKVNGCYLTMQQYWDVVQNIEYNGNIAGLIERVYAAETCSKVINLRAYVLASVYNAVQWDMLTKGAAISLNELYRERA